MPHMVAPPHGHHAQEQHCVDHEGCGSLADRFASVSITIISANGADTSDNIKDTGRQLQARLAAVAGVHAVFKKCYKC